MPGYMTDGNVYTLADTVAQSPDAKAKLWSTLLEVGSNTNDDFSFLEGAPESTKPFWKKTDLSKDGGDIVVFSTIGELGGEGVRGEAELSGNTPKPRMGTYQCQVDFWRNAVELTKKQRKFIPVGKSIESVLLNMLSKQLGRRKQRDMMHCLIRKANGNILRPNRKTSRNTLTATDTITPSFLVEAKARLQGQGARPTGFSKSKSGSEVNNFLAFICQDAMVDIRNSTSYQSALLQAAERSATANPLFTGKLVDWQSLFMFEHIVVDADADAVIGSPMAPKAKLGLAIAANTTAPTIKSSTTNVKDMYFQDFPGFDYQFVEGQTAAPDTTVYYCWIVNPVDAVTDPGKAGFYSYTGSTGNTGNTITVTQRLRASASGDAVATLGNVDWDADTMSDVHPVGATVIAANANGVPIGYSFLFGAGAALRAYGSITADPIAQDRDYKFVTGMGYESIYGQTITVDTQGKPRNYALLEHAFEHPGLPVPSVGA